MFEVCANVQSASLERKRLRGHVGVVPIFAAPMPNFRAVELCRICGNSELVPILDLGEQSLTGVFPRTPDEPVTRGPLELVKCSGGENVCGLVQLRHSYSPAEMYGESYGYRSSLNRSMVMHLAETASNVRALASPSPGDVIIDIGSNDGTTLSFFPADLVRVGVDPLASKFAQSYDADVLRIPDFFSAAIVDTVLGGRKAKIITSLAMFYDLENPQNFVNEVAGALAHDGLWYFEQSYMPLMLAMTSYDTICHEHLEYYALRQIEWLLLRAGLRVLDVNINDVNGGSFAITAAKVGSLHPVNRHGIDTIRSAERDAHLFSLSPFERFHDDVVAHRRALRDLVERINRAGETVLGYGASTKGNVLLQFCNFTTAQIPFIAEVNADKFGRVTPGTSIPIIPETEARAMKPDFFLALPWHFRNNLIEREREFLESGGRMIFPLPAIEIVDRESR